MKEKVKATKSKAKIIIVASIIILIVLAIIIVPKIRTSINNRRAAEVKSASRTCATAWIITGRIMAASWNHSGRCSFRCEDQHQNQDKWKFYIAWKEQPSLHHGNGG